MRRRRDKHAEDQVRERMIPAADAAPIAATNESLKGDGWLNGHPPVSATLSRAPQAPETPDVVLNEPVAATLAPAVTSVDALEATRARDTDGLDQPEDEPGGAHVMKGEAPTDRPRGAHVMKEDPLLSVERRAVHAMKVEVLPTTDVSTSTPEATPLVSAASDLAITAEAPTTRRRAARALKRAHRTTKRQGAHTLASRRWRVIPVAGAAGALAVGLGAGTAFAYLTTHGSGSGQTVAGSPVTIAVTATTGTADLLPGATGAVYFTLHNTDSSGATFDQVAPGATVVSDNTGLCASSYVSIAQTLPYTIPTAMTVSPGATSGVQSIASLVKLASNAPGMCQGVTFTVTLTLSGKSS